MLHSAGVSAFAMQECDYTGKATTQETNDTTDDEDDMRLRFSLPLTAILLASSLTAPAQAADGEAIFEDNCAGCHDGGGAPQIGDNDAWQSRIDEGMDELYASAINGVGGMPAKGGNADLTDDEVKAAVDYIVDESE